MAHRYRPFDWYETPLYYDIIFDTETEKECDFLEAVLERYGARAPGRSNRRQAARVLEPACGSGRLVVGMAARGYEVTGFDLSEGALAFAKTRVQRTRRTKAPAKALAKRARLAHGLMQSFRFPGRFDMAHCLVSSFRYLLSEDDACSHLEHVAKALRPGGIYVLGTHVTDYQNDSIARERWVASRGDVEVVCNIQGWPANRRTRRERMRSRLVVSRRGEITRYETSWHFRTYGVRQLRSLLAKVPALEHVATYDFDYDLDRPTDLGTERLDQVLILRRG